MGRESHGAAAGDLTSSVTLETGLPAGGPSPERTGRPGRGTPARRGPEDPEPGDVLGGRFEILSRLGTGGMGVVFKARDRLLEEVVALKTVRPDLPDRAEVMRRFRSEIRLARRIRRVNVAGMYDLLEADGLAFVTMEYVEGSDLKALVAAGTLGVEERLSIVRQLCLGLGAAHERGVVHRDLKPANVMVAPDGRAVILDFGIARSFRAGEATEGLVLGTPQYMAPEQARGEAAGPAADIYSLGVLVYELFTGRLPFRGDTPLEYVLKQIGEEPEPPSRHGLLPPGLEAVILTAMSKEPSRRYPDAARLLEALGRVGTERGATVRAPTARAALPVAEKKRLCLASLQASGFERLAGELEVEEIRHVRRDVLSSLESAAVRFGGTVVVREEAGLIAAFGLPAVRETDAERALAAARAATRVLARLEAPLRAALKLRAGLHADHVLVGAAADASPGLLGEATGVARAVASEAPPGGVALSGPFAALLPRGAAAAPVVARVRSGEGRVDVHVDSPDRDPDGDLERFEGPMVGRAAELETARAILRRVASGPGELLGVVGEAGIGKSRLVFEIAGAARAAGFHVLAGSCRTLDEQAVFQPVAQLLRSALELPEELPGGEALDELLAIRLAADGLDAPSPLVPAVAALLGAVHPRVAALTDAARKAAFREAVVAILAARARRAPLLLVVEDAHWLDTASADVLSAVASASPGLRLLVCAAYRPEWSPPWSGDEAFTRLVVRPLADDEVASLAARRAGVRDLAPELLALLREKAEGNPFFVEELLGALGDLGVLGVEDGRAVLARSAAAASVPARIEEIVLARIDRLEEQAKEALRSAAVIGRSFPVRLLGRLLGHDPESQELPQLSGAGMVYRKELLSELQYLFRHVVIRDVAYASLVEKRRRALHARLAASIEELYADRLDDWWEVLGRHHEEAGAFEKAKRCYARAAARARERVTDEVSDVLAGKEERMAEALMEARVETRVPLGKVLWIGVAVFVAMAAVLVVISQDGFPGGLPAMVRSRAGILKLMAALGVALGGSLFLAGSLAFGFWFDSAFVRLQRLALVVHSDRLTLGTRRGPFVVPFDAISEVFVGTLRELMPTALGMSVCDEGEATVPGRAAFVRWPRLRRFFSFGGGLRGERCLFVRKARVGRGAFFERTPYALEFLLVFAVLAVLFLAFVAWPPRVREGLSPLIVAWAVVPAGAVFLVDGWHKRWLTRHLPSIFESVDLVAIRTPDLEALERTLSSALAKFRRERASGPAS